MALTSKNEIVGTLFYMSPEQLQSQAGGQIVDGRSDIFSFGLVLYEMLTGKRAFDGASAASVIAGIIERPAPSIADIGRRSAGGWPPKPRCKPHPASCRPACCQHHLHCGDRAGRRA